MYMHDAMTGIYNRFALKSFGEPLLERNQIEGRRTLFMFADMDGLKHINDTYGHDVGDLSIKVMANVMQQSCPDSFSGQTCYKFLSSHHAYTYG